MYGGNFDTPNGSNEVSAEQELTVDMMRTIARHTRGQKLKLSHWSWMTMDLDNINSGRFVFSTLGVYERVR